MRQIVLASNNHGKIRQFNAIFAKHNIEVIPQAILGVPEVAEPYHTFIENSLHKARHCSKYTNLPTLADDSGLCVDALSGQPGVHSARYAGSPTNDAKNNRKLVQEIAHHKDRRANFYCVLVLVRHELDPQPLIVDGSLEGLIIDEARGNGGFGYNPHFLLPEYNKTLAEIDAELRDTICHRGIAVSKLMKQMESVNIFGK